MKKDRVKVRYGFAIFFILCGLIIGILGSYICMLRRYTGKIPLTDTRVPALKDMYPHNISMDSSILHYDIFDIIRLDDIRKLEGLSYTDGTHLMWLVILVGLIYVGLGVKSILSKDWLFKKEK